MQFSFTNKEKRYNRLHQSFNTLHKNKVFNLNLDFDWSVKNIILAIYQTAFPTMV